MTFAEGPGAVPNYIFPLYSGEYWRPYNTGQLQQLLYPPLYWYGANGTVDLDPAESLANPPMYSDSNRTVTITLKSGYTWSDGKPVTSRDVEFWINLLRANKANYGPYVPDQWPDNLESASYPDARTVVLHLKASYSPEWFTNMELPEITPIPQHVWDRTSVGGKIGNYDRSASGAQSVYKFLDQQAKNTNTYASNPLWKVVDGPWSLQSYTANGQLTFVRNSKYGGPDKPHLAKLVELPFTSDSAENAALLSGSVDYGYISPSNAAEIPHLKSLGYSITDWPLWESGFINLNFSNPEVGPILDQQYIRIAMTQLVNQPELIQSVYHGLASPSYSPVPTTPRTDFASASQYKNLYPYDPKAAIASLTNHGWAVHPNGTTTCTDPTKCGKNIKAGATLAFTLIYPTGIQADKELVQDLQSSMSAAGIRLELTALSPNEDASTLVECKPGSACKWGMLLYGGGGYYYQPGPYPDGSEPYGEGIVAYEGRASYVDKLDQLIAATRSAPASKQMAALYQYEAYAQEIVPDLFIPVPGFQVSAIRNTLHGAVPQNPLSGNMTPQKWYFSGN